MKYFQADLDALADEGIDIDLPEDGEYFLGNKTLNCVDSSNFPITFDGPKYCEPMSPACFVLKYSPVDCYQIA